MRYIRIKVLRTSMGKVIVPRFENRVLVRRGTTVFYMKWKTEAPQGRVQEVEP